MKRKLIFESRDLDCARWMFGLIQNLNPMQKEPSFEAWAHEIRLIREVDKRSYQDIATVFTWANKDGFWCSNILSPKALRRQFDRLVIQMKHAPTQKEKLKNVVTRTYENFKTKFGNPKAFSR